MSIEKEDLEAALAICCADPADNRYYVMAPAGARMYIGLLFYGRVFREKVSSDMLLTAFAQVEPELGIADIQYLLAHETDPGLADYFRNLLAARMHEAGHDLLTALGGATAVPSPAAHAPSGGVASVAPVTADAVPPTVVPASCRAPDPHANRQKASRKLVIRKSREPVAERHEEAEVPDRPNWEALVASFAVVLASAVLAAVVWLRFPGSPKNGSAPRTYESAVARNNDNLPVQPASPAVDDIFDCVAGGDGCIVKQYKGEGVNVRIPDRINNMPVTGIGRGAFSGCSGIKSVTMPDTVTDIEEHAFNGCIGLEEVVFPRRLRSIGKYAFYQCVALRSIRFPPDIDEIGYQAFKDCGNLKTVDVADVKTWCRIRFRSKTANPIGNKGCKLHAGGVLVKDLIVPAGVSTVNAYAFAGLESLESVSFPTGLDCIEPHAFEDCRNLRRIVFIGNAPVTGARAFVGLSPECAVVVQRGSKRWDVSIPGTWNGLKIEYAP